MDADPKTALTRSGVPERRFLFQIISTNYYGKLVQGLGESSISEVMIVRRTVK
jgi:hypothetical protein